MSISRKDVELYKNDLTRFYKCLTKIAYASRLPATKSAYALEVIRPGRIYDVYFCEYCGFYHVGRKSKYTKLVLIKRSEWVWDKGYKPYEYK